MSVSENDKRWLVVLVATDKIVAPVLRDLVAKGIGKLNGFLNDHLQNISTPCSLQTLTYLICHPSAPARPDPHLGQLKFQNINSNVGLSRRDYNYSVNSLADLAKLYLPGHLTNFAAFDNSMDMSAILRLLGQKNYPTQVFVPSNPFLDIKSLADDVRNAVRNPGAHYNENIWTEHFKNQCFEKLEALVKALVLPADQKKDSLDQLHQWKTNGWKLIIADDLTDLVNTFWQNQDTNLDSLLSIVESLLNRYDSIEERVNSTDERLESLVERHDELQRLVEVVVENLKKNQVNPISGAHNQRGVPAVRTSSPFSRTSVESPDDLSEEASRMNEESGDETCEGSTSSGVSENSIDSLGEDLPENQLHLECINPDIVLLKRQNGAPFKIEFTGKLPEGLESGVADFENLRKGVRLVKMGDKTLLGEALPYSLREGAFKVTVFSQNRGKCLGKTKVTYIDLIDEALKQAISCPKTMVKFIQVAIPCLNVNSEGGTCAAENPTNGGPSGWEKSSLSVQLLQRFIYAAAKVNAVWFIRLIFDLPAGRIAFDSYKGRPLLPEYVARARGHNQIAEYLKDVTKRHSESERADEKKFNTINWQEIVTAIEATQENPSACGEIIETEKNIDSHEAQGDDLKSSVSFQPEDGKEPLLRFWLGNSARAFEHYAKLAKDAFRAVGFAEEQINAIALTASDSPSLELLITKDGIKHKIHVDVNLLEGTNSSVESLDLKRELYQTAANFNDVPLQMNLTDPKMSGIKGWFKNERAFQFPCIWQVCKFLWSPFYLQTPWKCRDQEEGVVFFEKIGHLKVALFKSRGNTILLALLLPQKLSLLN